VSAEWPYHSLAIRAGGLADRWIEIAKQTNLETTEQVLERLVRAADPDLAVLGPNACRVHGGARMADAPGRCDAYDYARRCEFGGP
jgi:hypothetical protein